MPTSLVASTLASLIAITYVLAILGLGQAPAPDGNANALAGNMQVWHQAAVTYASNNPGVTGTVTVANLTLPTWYRTASTWSTVIGAGRSVGTYSGAIGGLTPARLAGALSDFLSGYSGVGVVASGVVIGRDGVAVAVPVGVPNGVAAIVTTVGP